MTEYLHVAWAYHDPKMPVDIYSELDDERWETRKVEAFADGRLQFSDGVDSTGGTGLSEVPMPTVDEINPKTGLISDLIDEAAFEEMWRRATSPGADQPQH